MTELAVNIIVESMYIQCDVNGNKYLSLEAFINHKNNGSALSEEYKQVVVKGQGTLRKSTADYDIHCEWKDRSTLWEN